MSCCNHECRQGRDCPNRASKAPLSKLLAVVAVMLATVIYMAIIVNVG